MSKPDQRWEFSAPKFVDFTKLQQEDGVDDWFETRRESQGDYDVEAPAISVTRGSIAPKVAKADDDDDGLVSQLATKFGLTTPKEFNFATSKRKRAADQSVSASPAPALQFASFAATPMSARASVSNRASTAGPSSARKSTAPGSAVSAAPGSAVQSYYPLRSTKPLTMPKEFNFASSKRVRERPAAEPSPAVVAPPPKVAKTVPAPRVPRVATLKPAVKAAAAAKLETPKPVVATKPRGLTMPRSPKLHSAKRSAIKPPVLPAPVAEAKPAAPFKAAPAPKKVLNSRAGQIGIRMVQKRSETVARGINFSTDLRPKARPQPPAAAKIAPKEEPVAPPVRMPAQTPRGPTRAMSPKLSTKKRAEVKLTMSAVKPEATPKLAPQSQFRARPMPDFGKSPAVVPASAGPKSTGKRLSERASVAPTDSAKKPRVTNPVPFKLHSDTKATAAAEHAKAKISQEIAQEVAKFSHFVTSENAHVLPLHDSNGKKPAKPAKLADVVMSKPKSEAPLPVVAAKATPMAIDEPAPQVAAFDFSADAYDVEAGVPMSEFAPVVPTGAGLRAL